MTTNSQCVLRTALCDGQSVVDFTNALRHRCGCYCAALDRCRPGDDDFLAEALRSARARTVARAPELERLTERHDRLSAPPTW